MAKKRYPEEAIIYKLREVEILQSQVNTAVRDVLLPGAEPIDADYMFAVPRTSMPLI